MCSVNEKTITEKETLRKTDNNTKLVISLAVSIILMLIEGTFFVKTKQDFHFVGLFFFSVTTLTLLFIALIKMPKAIK